ncbi:hypothetical protein PPYR_07225 [Photinus pyralis]|uniref:Cilia- and flagella-associated protein 97 n=1 Tax=Photinus pyralis TaxID=7054 RepID=A0A1Y1NDX2_PHOPY|nr:hypothetical protein PPYR_07225 [Photinus pyralis]
MSETNNDTAVENVILDDEQNSNDFENSSSTHSLSINSDLQHTDALKKSCGPKIQNKTFSMEQTREIERRNDILMKKILAHSKRESRYGPNPVYKKLSSSALNRKKKDMEISRNNLMLLRKIQTVKPFGMSIPKC